MLRIDHMMAVEDVHRIIAIKLVALFNFLTTLAFNAENLLLYEAAKLWDDDD